MFLVAHIFLLLKGMTSLIEERFGLMEEDGTKTAVFNMTSRDIVVTGLSVSGNRAQRAVLFSGDLKEFDFIQGVDCFFLEDSASEKSLEDFDGIDKEKLFI